MRKPRLRKFKWLAQGDSVNKRQRNNSGDSYSNSKSPRFLDYILGNSSFWYALSVPSSALWVCCVFLTYVQDSTTEEPLRSQRLHPGMQVTGSPRVWKANLLGQCPHLWFQHRSSEPNQYHQPPCRDNERDELFLSMNYSCVNKWMNEEHLSLTVTAFCIWTRGSTSSNYNFYRIPAKWLSAFSGHFHWQGNHTAWGIQLNFPGVWLFRKKHWSRETLENSRSWKC